MSAEPTPAEPMSAEPTESASAPPSGPPDGRRCTTMAASADGSLPGARSSQAIPARGYVRAGHGRHVACLSTSEGAQFTLVLQQWTGHEWRTVAQATSNGDTDAGKLSYDGAAGYYQYRVTSTNDAGSYVLSANVP
jgi:hypothetical protein